MAALYVTCQAVLAKLQPQQTRTDGDTALIIFDLRKFHSAEESLLQKLRCDCRMIQYHDIRQWGKSGSSWFTVRAAKGLTLFIFQVKSNFPCPELDSDSLEALCVTCSAVLAKLQPQRTRTDGDTALIIFELRKFHSGGERLL